MSFENGLWHRHCDFFFALYNMTCVRMRLQNPLSLLMALLNKFKNWNSFAKIRNTLITLIRSLRTSFEYKLVLILGFAKFDFWLGKNNIGTLVHVWIIFYFPIGTGPVQLLLIKSLSKTSFLIPVGTRYFPHVLGDNIASIQLEFKFGKIQDRDQFILVYMYFCNTFT